MWRVVSVLIVVFWAVMLTLLVRFTWFPEGTQFSEVPPRMVLQKFLEQGSAASTPGQFHIYRREQKIGHASVSCRRVRSLVRVPEADFALRIDGLLEQGALGDAQGSVSFGVELKLRDVQTFAGAKGHLRMEGNGSRNGPRAKARPGAAAGVATGTVISFTWDAGASRPSVVMKRDGMVVVDDQLLEPMVAQALGAGAGTAVGGVGMAEVGSLVELKARESVKTFAGQRSKGHTLDLTAMDRWRIRAFFTEAGELVLVDLPEGYRLVEPVIHGLTPDYEDDEEEEGREVEGEK